VNRYLGGEVDVNRGLQWNEERLPIVLNFGALQHRDNYVESSVFISIILGSAESDLY
jgi:hypothetical protein